jgi:hypothetical protein
MVGGVCRKQKDFGASMLDISKGSPNGFDFAGKARCSADDET